MPDYGSQSIYAGSSVSQFLSRLQDSLNVNGDIDPTKWMLVTRPRFSPNVSPAWSVRATIGNSTFDGNPALLWSLCWDGSSSANTSWPTLIAPIKQGVWTTLIKAQQHYSEMVILKCSANFGLSSGPAVGWNPADSQGMTAYHLALQTDSTFQWTVRRFNQGAASAILISGNGVTGGDRWRINFDLTTPGQTVINTKQNGTPVTQYIDTSGSRLTQGGPTATCISAATSGNVEMRNFDMGVGL